MEIYKLQSVILGFVVLIVIVVVLSVAIPEIIEAYQIQSLDGTCYQSEKVRYCESIGMELGSIVITPAGLFGGTPYNKEACVSESSEKMIEFKELNWKKCKLK